MVRERGRQSRCLAARSTSDELQAVPTGPQEPSGPRQLRCQRGLHETHCKLCPGYGPGSLCQQSSDWLHCARLASSAADLHVASLHSPQSLEPPHSRKTWVCVKNNGRTQKTGIVNLDYLIAVSLGKAGLRNRNFFKLQSPVASAAATSSPVPAVSSPAPFAAHDRPRVLGPVGQLQHHSKP